jgi:hypothetical protein
MRKDEEDKTVLPDTKLGVSLEIDTNDLLGECRRQMRLEEQFGKLLAEATYRLEVAETAVKTRRSELVLAVESDSSIMEGGVRLNASTVEAYYRTRKSYKRLVEHEAKMRYNKTMIEQACFSLARRSQMLILLVNSRLRTAGDLIDTATFGDIKAKQRLAELTREEVHQRTRDRLQKRKGD